MWLPSSPAPNHGIVQVGKDIKDHLVPTLLPCGVHPLPEERVAGGAEEGIGASSPYALCVHSPMPGTGEELEVMASLWDQL